jgi:hypothetical protein
MHLQQLNLSYNRLQSLPIQIASLVELFALDLSGNEEITSPPLEICEAGLQAVREYLTEIPASLEDLQEGWEIVEPSSEDIQTEFGLTSSDVTPFRFKTYSEEFPPQPEVPLEAPAGWISSTFHYLSRSIWG